MLAHSTPTFCIHVCPNLKGLLHELDHIDWTWSINTQLTNCMSTDILVDVVLVLDKCNINYVDIHRFCKQHYFNQDLNSHKCTMHQTNYYVTEPTYMYIVTVC